MRLTNKYISKSMEFLCRELSRCLTERKEQGSVVIEQAFKKLSVCITDGCQFVASKKEIDPIILVVIVPHHASIIISCNGTLCIRMRSLLF